MSKSNAINENTSISPNNINFLTIKGVKGEGRDVFCTKLS